MAFARPVLLPEWETFFAEALHSAGPGRLFKGGALVKIVPGGEEWESFRFAAASGWKLLRFNPERYPATLILLYAGNAFFDFGDDNFWEAFAKLVEDPGLVEANAQAKLNSAYREACTGFGLSLFSTGTYTAYVGTAIHHVGVPLRLWRDFLEMCQWAVDYPDWASLDKVTWNREMTRFSLTSRRLNRFLTADRSEAERMVRELLEARVVLCSDPSLPIDEAKHLCNLRPEYFDQVPETASFLRPLILEQARGERPRLYWSNSHRTLSIHLPAIKNTLLPAFWRLGIIERQADVHPDGFSVDGMAFEPQLDLMLQSATSRQAIPVEGIRDWALFDEDNGGAMVQSNRPTLPRRYYSLISKEPLLEVKFEGFDTDDQALNEPTGLADGTDVFLTKLYPNDYVAYLTFDAPEGQIRLKFATQSFIEAKLFAGAGTDAFCCEHQGSTLLLDRLPLLALAVPYGHFDGPTQIALNGGFRVQLAGQFVPGTWEPAAGNAFEGKELFQWVWPGDPTEGFAEGQTSIVIQAEDQSFKAEFAVKLKAYNHQLRLLLANLPGSYLPLILLAQQPTGMTWGDLQWAKDIIEPKGHLSGYAINRYLREEIITRANRRWIFKEARARLTESSLELTLEFAGNPTLLWHVIKRMAVNLPDSEFQKIQTSFPKGMPPVLVTKWPVHCREKLLESLRAKDISLQENLWNT